MNFAYLAKRTDRDFGGGRSIPTLPVSGNFEVSFSDGKTSFLSDVVVESSAEPKPIGGYVIRSSKDGALVRVVAAHDLIGLASSASPY